MISKSHNSPQIQTAISAPANNKSGSGSLDATPRPLDSESDYGLLPAGAPATGSDPEDGMLNLSGIPHMQTLIFARIY
jgi:hypothetical protein